VAKFAAGGKPVNKKDLSLIASMYGHVYVARVAMGAKMPQVVQALMEAEAYPGPSLIVGLQPLHRARLRHGARHGAAEAGGIFGRLAALSVRPAARRERRAADEARLQCSHHAVWPTTCATRRRFRVVERTDPERFRRFVKEAQEGAQRRYAVYQQLAGITIPQVDAGEDAPTPAAPADSEE
jgi:pyruvate-ferredoxin/flavodoxin oxidoreductase